MGGGYGGFEKWVERRDDEVRERERERGGGGKEGRDGERMKKSEL